ncbi:hypothetical protein M8J76_000785 [Diaphorina citri]|nr:hypothetical protein M8J77_022930 [Diaphorina citri]KAI5718823.1 hypothetical protein M8J76_000785 [Diaphorina citri]KAI5721212.1 hypothetical protein M8J77_017588 [Diaphorina citri]
MLGLHEEVARIYIKDRRVADEISNDVAQFLNLSLVECHAKLEKFNKKLKWICAKYSEMARRIRQRLEHKG